MSPRKLTEDDKQEILQQYRNSEATTSTLAKSFEVSSSTISRFLKSNLSTVEYEDLIQQKRLARTPRGEKSSSKAEDSSKKPKTQTKTKSKSRSKSQSKSQPKSQSTTKPKTTTVAIANDDAMPELATAENLQLELATDSATESQTITSRRRRRRRSAAAQPEIKTPETETVATEVKEIEAAESEIDSSPTKLVLDHKIRNKSDEEAVPKSERLILKSDRVDPEDDEEDDAMDITALTEMLGEDLEDINDDEDDEEDEDWEEDEILSYPSKRAELNDVQILPLSQASLPRTCYLVIDRSAELIVKPLADFGDLGIIPDTEVQQRTLPVFDNHRIAKRFSHRRERVIKVPDGRMLQKTSHHLQDKGITRLLIDGQIYSLSH
ncbi:MAG: hypothetical protein AAGF83_19605 [Cyanobacteria bacterium P01_G01_bin.67]